jgi:hypothetical protein
MYKYKIKKACSNQESISGTGLGSGKIISDPDPFPTRRGSIIKREIPRFSFCRMIRVNSISSLSVSEAWREERLIEREWGELPLW